MSKSRPRHHPQIYCPLQSDGQKANHHADRRISDTAHFSISVFSFTNQLLDTPLLYNRSCLRPAVYDLPCVVNCLRLLHRHMVLSFSDILNGAPVLAWISSAVMPSRCSVRRNPSDGET